MKASENCVVNVQYVYIKIYNILKNSDDKHVIKMSLAYTVLAKYGTYDKRDF
jgi:hypothetical protein